MPIYEYVCEDCREKFEKWHRSIACAEEPRCPKCGSAQVKKAISILGKGGATSGPALSDSSCAPTGG